MRIHKNADKRPSLAKRKWRTNTTGCDTNIISIFWRVLYYCLNADCRAFQQVLQQPHRAIQWKSSHRCTLENTDIFCRRLPLSDAAEIFLFLQMHKRRTAAHPARCTDLVGCSNTWGSKGFLTVCYSKGGHRNAQLHFSWSPHKSYFADYVQTTPATVYKLSSCTAAW